MKKSVIMFIILSLVFVSSILPESLKIKIDKINDRITVYRMDKPGSPAITSISTKKGIVIIDTHYYSDFVKEVKKRISKDYKNNKIRYVINTHHHFDHSGGNHLFPEALIIGHINSVEAQKKFNNNKAAFIKRRKKALKVLKEKIKKMVPDSTLFNEYSGRIKGYESQIDELSNRFKMRLPDITFSDDMTLDLGDIKFKLKLFNGIHTDNDILICIVGGGFVFTGDIFWKGKLTFATDNRDFSTTYYLSMLDWILHHNKPGKSIIEGHFISSREEFIEKKEYILSLKNKIIELYKLGLAIDEIKNSVSLKEHFKTLKYFDIRDSQNIKLHNNNISFLISRIKNNN